MTVPFSSPPELAAHQLYAIVARQTGDGGDSSNRYNWRRSSDSNDIYTRGNSFTSSDSGSTWTTSSTYAYTFKVFTNYANTPTDLRVALHDDDDRDGVPDAPAGGTLADSHEGTDDDTIIQDRTYRAQVFTPTVGGTLDRVELLLHTYTPGDSDLLVSVQETAGDYNVTVYGHTSSTNYGNIYSTQYGANTFYPEFSVEPGQVVNIITASSLGPGYMWINLTVTGTYNSTSVNESFTVKVNATRNATLSFNTPFLTARF